MKKKLIITQKNKKIMLSLLLSVSIIGSFLFLNRQPKEYEYVAAEEYSTKYQTVFIDKIADEAQNLQAQTNLFASITIAQAILESDWGNSELAQESNNLFGIKAQESDQSTTLPTDEYEDGERITIDAAFKKYDTVQESMVDHIVFLEGASYAPVKTAKNYIEAAHALKAGGYATDPKYAEKLIELIEQFKLDKFDTI